MPVLSYKQKMCLFYGAGGLLAIIDIWGFAGILLTMVAIIVVDNNK